MEILLVDCMAFFPQSNDYRGIRLPRKKFLGTRASPDMNRIGRERMAEMYLVSSVISSFLHSPVRVRRCQ